jgi:actin-like ATPase involved in cell morphogenesis
LDEGLTGICLSYGAGMTNASVIHQGDPLVEFSMARGGDFIDQSVGNALDESPSLIQLEKESGVNLFNPTNKIMEAVSVYYSALINYTLENIVYELERRGKELPKFKSAVPIVVSGGLSLAEGFTEKVEESLRKLNFPVKISGVRKAKSPMTAVSNGCLLAAQL